MRQGKVFYQDHFAGIVTETNDGDFTFQYDQEYVQKFPNQLITFSIPVSGKVYRENRLFPFFEGLIPKGWLLEIASESWKINKNDRMGLLLACCKNSIGAVSIEPINSVENE
ncbi:MAG: HipA N-terminal domain-containing protein [Chitinophagales bacterium]|nr:HipA N-terminal domain-containing protein [Chitinophagales bacterium]